MDNSPPERNGFRKSESGVKAGVKNTPGLLQDPMGS